jgi:riboflavin biosynthesis pyrimidine reductase
VIRLYPDASDDPFEPLERVLSENRSPVPTLTTASGSSHQATVRPWVFTNMIASADGATAVNGVSGDLGGPADQAVFAALRSVADAIVVGASTVRRERYRPPGDGGEQGRVRRLGRGQPERPLVVVISASLALDPSLPLFGDPSYRPLIITVDDSPPEQRRALSAVADVVVAGSERVDPATALALVAERGCRTALAEGGPSLNGQLLAADLIDEWNLTLSPLLVGGRSPRPAFGNDLVPPGIALTLTRVWLADDLLFCRWVRSSRA